MIIFGMKNKLRIFIAVPLSDEIKKNLEEVIINLKETGADIKCVRPENAHLTLRFLGQVEETRIANIKEVMGNVLRDTTFFDMVLSGVGAFPGKNSPRVVWVGVKTGAEKLLEIHDVLEENLAAAGFEKETRKYHSHLTLARVKSARSRKVLISWLELNENLNIGSMRTSEIVLMESRLKREGAEYLPLEVVTLR